MRAALFSCALLLAACGGGGGSPPTPGAASAPQEAIARAGDVTMRASVVETMTLSAEITRQYGITRSDDTVLLLVAVRKGADDATAVSMPATITATATNLRGGTQAVTMRELRSGSGADALLDYAGIATVTPPETMRFDVRIVRADGTSTMSFTREFYPR